MMPFAGVDNAELSRTPSGQQPNIGFNRPPQLGNIVPQHLTESAGLEKVALHIDDKQRAIFRDEIKWIGLGRDVHTR